MKKAKRNIFLRDEDEGKTLLTLVFTGSSNQLDPRRSGVGVLVLSVCEGVNSLTALC